MISIDYQTLQQFVQAIFVANGASAENGQIVAQSLVGANLAGHDSHGVMRTIQYLEAIQTGNVTPAATASLESEDGATAVVNGGNSFGQVGAKFAIEDGIARAKEHGISGVTLFNSHHVGRVGEWVLMAAEQNMAAIAFCNVASQRAHVAPHGGMEKLLNTNPFAAAVPIANREPFLVDFATSVVAEGKVRVAKIAQKPIPEGWILDKNGLPSTDPNDLYNGGMLRPAGQYKGYGLSLLSELLGGVMTRTGWPSLAANQRMRNGMLLIVLDIARFRPIVEFLTDSGTLYDNTKAIKPDPNHDDVLFPGEPELISAEKRKANGIPLDAEMWAQLVEAANTLGVTIPAL